MASVHRRISSTGTETFRVAYRADSKPSFTQTFPTAAGAIEAKNLIERLGWEAALGVISARSTHRTDGPPLLRDWFERHLSLLGADSQPGTVVEYRRMAARTWLPSLGPLPIDAITREAVVGWVAWQRVQLARGGKPYAPKSIRNAHGLLSGVLASAVTHDAGIVRNVAARISLPKDGEGGEMEIFTQPEWAKFYVAMDVHYRPLILFLVATGVRIGEATAVQVRDLDLDAAMPTVRIRRAWKAGDGPKILGAPKTRRGTRTIVLPAELVDTLRAVTAGNAATSLVFTGRQGGRISAQHFRSRQWERALTAAVITKHLTPHSLRHTSASWLLTAGVAPQVVQHRLGHESLSTTSKVYAHLLTDAQLGAVAVTQAAIASKPRQIGA